MTIITLNRIRPHFPMYLHLCLCYDDAMYHCGKRNLINDKKNKGANEQLEKEVCMIKYTASIRY